MVPEIGPIHLEATMVVHVYELVRNCAFHVLFTKKVAST